MDCAQTRFFTEGELDRDDIRALIAHHVAEMRGDSPPEACHVLPLADLAADNVRLLSCRDGDGRLLGIGALKIIGPGHGELKSMRTHPDALRSGVGSAMLDRLVALAREAGMVRLSLETGNSPLFAAANRLYLRMGFKPCGPFGSYADTPFTLFYTRLLD